MALLDLVLANPLAASIGIAIQLLLFRIIYRIFFHPISHFPGPLLPKCTSLWLHYHAYIGDEATVIHAAHKKYGPYVRVSPNEVDISDGDAIPAIYTERGGFPKADCYGNFDIDGHKTLFSAVDATHRAPRAKAVVPMFSTASIRLNTGALYGCVDRMVQRMHDESLTGKPVNVLNLTRSLAVDAVSTHLFQQNYDGTSEKTERLSVSLFVDAFVAVGRFFYLPNRVFLWAEWLSEKIAGDESTHQSMEVVDKFVDSLVNSTMADKNGNYPARLMDLGISFTEVKAQCKDLIFAGTDSTGMNLAILCRQLVLNPDKYEKLRQEIIANRDTRAEIQSLPYLTGVVKESLRLSMANPTRLPHVVPSPGWTFKNTFFPPSTIVGCSAFELHYDSTSYPSPKQFLPERWINPTPEMARNWFAFGAGSRQCIARNLATTELYMAAERLVERDVLRGARVPAGMEGEVEIYEWFNSKVKGEKIELVWERS